VAANRTSGGRKNGDQEGSPRRSPRRGIASGGTPKAGEPGRVSPLSSTASAVSSEMTGTISRVSFTPKEMYKVADRNSINAQLHRVEGQATKFSRYGYLCCTREVEHHRWFVIDPKEATLEYWTLDQRTGPARRTYYLRKLKMLERNDAQWYMSLEFRDTWRCLQIQWDSLEEYKRWLVVLKHYDLKWLSSHPPANDDWDEQRIDAELQACDDHIESEVSSPPPMILPKSAKSLPPTGEWQANPVPSRDRQVEYEMSNGVIREVVVKDSEGAESGDEMQVQVSRL